MLVTGAASIGTSVLRESICRGKARSYKEVGLKEAGGGFYRLTSVLGLLREESRYPALGQTVCILLSSLSILNAPSPVQDSSKQAPSLQNELKYQKKSLTLDELQITREQSSLLSERPMC